jgi:hypothetical protein
MVNPAKDPSGNIKTGPQLGNVVLVDVGTWNNMVGTTFSYQWKTSPDRLATTNVATSTGMSNATKRNYAPSMSQIGQYLAVTITATNTASGDTAGSYTVFTTQKVVGINPNRVNPYPSSGPIGPDLAANGGSVQPGENYSWFTWYGVPDNTPPGAAIGGPSSGATNSYPGNYGSAVHSGQRAGGDGSYNNPLTAATANTVAAPYGVQFYIPKFQKYFVTEDGCTECRSDWSGRVTSSSDLIGVGGDGGPGMIHFDLWIDGGDGDWVEVLQCQDSLTPDPTEPALIIMDPSPNMPVNPDPIFNPTTGECNYFEDNGTKDYASWPKMSIDLDSTDTVGQYQNFGTGTEDDPNGLCITNPGNSAIPGTLVTLEPCADPDDPADADLLASQMVSYVGLLLIMNNLCLDMGNQSGNNQVARAVSLQKCNFNVGQLWEEDETGWSDVQNSNWALADGNRYTGATYLKMTDPAHIRLAGTNNQTTVTGSTAGLLIATRNAGTYTNNNGNQWVFPGYPEDSAQIPIEIDVDLADITKGSTIEITGAGVNTPSVEIALVSADDPDKVIAILGRIDNVGAMGVSTPDNTGVFKATVTIPDNLPPGDYQIRVRSLADIYPVGTVLVDGDVFVKASPLPQTGGSGATTLANFPAFNRSVPMYGWSGTFSVAAPPAGPEADTGGLTPTSPWLPIAGLATASVLVLGLGLLLQRRRVNS